MRKRAYGYYLVHRGATIEHDDVGVEFATRKQASESAKRERDKWSRMSGKPSGSVRIVIVNLEQGD